MFIGKIINNMLNIIKRSKLLINLLILVVLFVLIYMGSSIAYKITAIKTELEPISQPTIRVSGKAILDKKPDIALLQVGVENEAKDVASAQEKNSQFMNNIIDYLKKQNIKEEDLKTTSYSIQPRYEYNPDTGKRNLVAYQVSQRLNVRIRDFSKISSLLDNVTRLGANQIGNVAFMIDDEIAAQSEARNEAIKNAKKKAKVLAKQLDVGLGNLVDFQESINAPYVYRDSIEGYGTGGDNEKLAAPQLEPGTTEITSQVILIYEIN